MSRAPRPRNALVPGPDPGHHWPVSDPRTDPRKRDPEPPGAATSRRDPTRSVDDARFLERLGRNVRAARGRRGLSRRLVARYAGVSERYLAQLEAGRGNVSVLLLRQIAAALDVPLETLLADRDAELGELVALLRDAGPAQRARARAALAAEDRASRRRRRVALIGLRGAGKSTLGRAVADDLALPFVELNDVITELAGLAVHEIFDLYGPEGYRRFERRALEETVARHESLVLASGGGIVSDPETFDQLLAACLTIWLRAAPEEHMRRVRAQGDLRPMADNADAMEDLELILDSREALYRRAHRQLDTSGHTETQSREALVAMLRAEGFARIAHRPRGR